LFTFVCLFCKFKRERVSSQLVVDFCPQQCILWLALPIRWLSAFGHAQQTRCPFLPLFGSARTKEEEQKISVHRKFFFFFCSLT
jgi:hypothetical protein